MVFGSSFLPMTDRELVKTIDLHPQPNHSTCKTVRSSSGGFGLDGLPGLQNGSAAPKSRSPQMVAQTLGFGQNLLLLVKIFLERCKIWSKN
ncbi:unnamed protein product [Camellia sinensis]